MRVSRSSQPWQDEKGSKSAGLLISILVRYPELASVNFDPRRQTLKFTFLVREQLERRLVQRLVRSLRLNLDVLSGLENKQPGVISYGHVTYGPVTAIEVTRDVGTLTLEEISLLIQLMKDRFEDLLVIDQVAGASLDEELAFQEELIGQMLEDLKAARQDRDLIAVREEGRVLVFNK